MNENLQEALVEILKSAISVKDFIVNETPEVVQQLLLYNFVVSLIYTIIGIIMVIISYKFFKSSKKLMLSLEETTAEFQFGFSVVVGSVLGLVGIVLIFHGDWLQIWLAPKVYLIEYLRYLINGV